MYIEAEARSLITDAIELDKDITSIEIREKLRGKIIVQDEDYLNLKKKVI